MPEEAKTKQGERSAFDAEEISSLDLPVGGAQPADSFILVNACESTVIRTVAEMMQYFEMCRCEKCFKDTCALVLNQMKPHYVTTAKGTMLSQLASTEIGRHTDLNIKVSKALHYVKDHPQHEL